MIAIIRNLELGIHNLSNSQFLFPSSKVRLQKKKYNNCQIIDNS